MFKMNCLSVIIVPFYIFGSTSAKSQRHLFSFGENVCGWALHFSYGDLFCRPDVMVGTPARKTTFYFVFCFLIAYSWSTCLMKYICELEIDLD